MNKAQALQKLREYLQAQGIKTKDDDPEVYGPIGSGADLHYSMWVIHEDDERVNYLVYEDQVLLRPDDKP